MSLLLGWLKAAGAFLLQLAAIRVRLPLGLIVAVLLVGYWQHSGAVSKAYKSGREAMAAEMDKKVRAIEGRAERLAAQLRKKNDETARAIAADADVIRVSGPGKARCPVVPAGPGGPGATSRPADAPGSEVPPGDRAAVPWSWLVNRAERCDLNRAEVLSWREWYEDMFETWAKG